MRGSMTNAVQTTLDALGVDARDRLWVDRSRLGRPGALHLDADSPPTILHLQDPENRSQTMCGERAGGGISTEIRHRAPTTGNVAVCTRCEEIARSDEEEAAPDGGRHVGRGAGVGAQRVARPAVTIEPEALPGLTEPVELDRRELIAGLVATGIVGVAAGWWFGRRGSSP